MQATSENDAGRRPVVDSVGRAMAIIGDGWVVLILRELFFGIRRFDQFHKSLGVAPNILTARLKRLVAHGLIAKRRYSERPPRYEYCLTDKGRDLYPAIVLIMRWGDRWLDEGQGAPLVLVHKDCGHVLAPTLRCDGCGSPIEARGVMWRLGPAG